MYWHVVTIVQFVISLILQQQVENLSLVAVHRMVQWNSSITLLLVHISFTYGRMLLVSLEYFIPTRWSAFKLFLLQISCFLAPICHFKYCLVFIILQVGIWSLIQQQPGIFSEVPTCSMVQCNWAILLPMNYIRFHHQQDFIGISGVVPNNPMECLLTIFTTQIDQINTLQ